MDFSALVLGPCMDAFGLAITVAPAKSQPGAPIYGSQPGKPLRGIWTTKPVVIETSTGFHSTNQPELGIRLADFDAIGQAYPGQSDFLSLDGDPAGICWEVTDAQPDGQGGSTLMLRLVRGKLADATSDPVPQK